MIAATLFLIFIPVLAITALLMTERGKGLKDYLRFFTAGLDSGFSIPQILFLGKVGNSSGLDDLTRLFWSIPSLDLCTAEIIRRAKHSGKENDIATQTLLSRLYKYRTKIELEQSQRKRGLESTRDIIVGQRVRILLHGVGVFSSRVITNTSRDLVLEFPVGNKTAATSINWKNQALGVYFWRQEDAGYVFDTTVISDPHATGRAVLHITHSHNLIRSQKRKSIRVKCSIYAQMYLLKPEEPLEFALEPEPGMKCLLEDLSEDGAMVIIGGKGVKDMQIKLQFLVHDVLIVMAGKIRAVEFNPETNQSRIHFESGELNPRMKNAILSFVYNVLPAQEREELDAIRLTEEDGLSDAENADSAPGLEDLDEQPDFTGTNL